MAAVPQSWASLSRNGALGDNKLDRTHPNDGIRKAGDAQHELATLRTFLEGDLNVIKVSPKYTNVGRQDAIRRAAESALGKLKALKEQKLYTLAKLRLDLVEAKIQGREIARQKTERDAYQAIREMEIRDRYLRPMTLMERKLATLKAIEDGPDELLDAALNDPAGEMLNPDDAAEVKAALIKKRYPDLSADFAGLQHAVDVLETEAATTEQGIRKLGGIPVTMRERLGGGFDHVVPEPEPEPEPVEA